MVEIVALRWLGEVGTDNACTWLAEGALPMVGGVRENAAAGVVPGILEATVLDDSALASRAGGP